MKYIIPLFNFVVKCLTVICYKVLLLSQIASFFFIITVEHHSTEKRVHVGDSTSLDGVKKLHRKLGLPSINLLTVLGHAKGVCRDAIAYPEP